MTSAIHSQMCRPSMACPRGVDRQERDGALLRRQDLFQGNPSDLLSLSDPTATSTNLTTSEQWALRARSQASLIQSDDGSLVASVRTRLRFAYEYQASDGTTIRITAKANLKYLQVADGDSEATAIKLRVQARVSILQQDVASGVGELVDGSSLTDEARTALTHALGLFQEATDSLSSTFAASNPLDGDSLIAGLVGAFNALATSATESSPQELPASQQIPAEQPADASVESSVETAALPANSASLPSVSATQPETALPTAEIPEFPLPASDAVQPATAGESTVTADSASTDSSVAENEVASEGGSQPNFEPPSSTQGSDAAPALSVRSVMLQVRMKVVESLTHLVADFDSPNGHLSASRSIYRASINLAAHYSSVTQDMPAPNAIDAQV